MKISWKERKRDEKYRKVKQLRLVSRVKPDTVNRFCVCVKVMSLSVNPENFYNLRKRATKSELILGSVFDLFSTYAPLHVHLFLLYADYGLLVIQSSINNVTCKRNDRFFPSRIILLDIRIVFFFFFFFLWFLQLLFLLLFSFSPSSSISSSSSPFSFSFPSFLRLENDEHLKSAKMVSLCIYIKVNKPIIQINILKLMNHKWLTKVSVFLQSFWKQC